MFVYADANGDGSLSPDELTALIDRFGIKLVPGQLDGYLGEFSSSGDGRLTQHEFVSLMSKLQGRLGMTANPSIISKDLEITVKKLEQMLGSNERKARAALDVLLSQAREVQHAQPEAHHAMTATSPPGKEAAGRGDAAARCVQAGVCGEAPARRHGRAAAGRASKSRPNRDRGERERDRTLAAAGRTVIASAALARGGERNHGERERANGGRGAWAGRREGLDADVGLGFCVAPSAFSAPRTDAQPQERMVVDTADGGGIASSTPSQAATYSPAKQKPSAHTLIC